VSDAMGMGSQILARTTTTITRAYGFFTTLFNDVGNATVTTYYSYFAKAPSTNGVLTMTTHYGLYLESTAATGWTKWGVYQADLGAKNLFAGKSVLGTESASVYSQRLDSAYNFTATNGTNILCCLQPTATPAADSSCSFQGIFLQMINSGTKNFTGSTYGLNMQAVHNSTGTCTALYGISAIAYKQAAGAVTSAYAFYGYVISPNATAQIGTASCFYAAGPNTGGGTGFITTLYGLYIEAQKVTNVTTGYGVYQAGTTDLNTFLGLTGHGIAASTSSFCTFAAATTAISSYRITTGVKPTNPVDGDTWYDSTQKCDAYWRDGILQYSVTTLFEQTNSVTIANDNTEKTLLGTGIGGLTLPANFFVPGKKFRIHMRGIIRDTAAPTGRLRMLLGATVITDTGAQALGVIAADDSWELTGTIVCRTTGAPGTVVGSFDFYYHNAGGVGATTEIDVNPAVVNLTTTGALTLDVLWTWSAANANNSITCLLATVEVMS